MNRAIDRPPLPQELIERENAARLAALQDEYDSLGRALDRRGRSIDAVKDKVKAFAVAVPTWGLGVGGTRFAKFPIPGEPIGIHEKLEDAAVVNQLGRMTPTASPHFPVGQGRRPTGAEGGSRRARPRLRRGELQHLPGPARPGAGATSSARSPTPTRRCATRPSPTTSTASTSAWRWARRRSPSGSATAPTSPASRTRPRRSTAISNSMSQIYAALPADWRMFMEHKLYEPAFYSTVITRLGHQPARRPAARRARPAASSTSATMRRT